MIELPTGPVRIGRGPHCEVRLGRPSASAKSIACSVDAGIPGTFSRSGRRATSGSMAGPADQQRPVPAGRARSSVGDHWLVLRPGQIARPTTGAPSNAPITVETQPEPEPEPEPEPVQATAEPRSRPSPHDGPVRPRPTRPVGRQRGAAPSLGGPPRAARAMAQGPPGGASLGGPMEVGRRDDPIQVDTARHQARPRRAINQSRRRPRHRHAEGRHRPRPAARIIDVAGGPSRS